MGARSTFPIREEFHLDKQSQIETVAKDLGYDLGSAGTLRLIVLGATVVQAAGAGTDATIELQDADNADAPFFTITSSDLAKADANGVYIDHLRGALFDGIRNVKMAYAAGVAGGGTAGEITDFQVYLDRV